MADGGWYPATVARKTTAGATRAEEARRMIADLTPEDFAELRQRGNALGLLPLVQELASSQPSAERLRRWGIETSPEALQRAARVFRVVQVAALQSAHVSPAAKQRKDAASATLAKLARVAAGDDPKGSLCKPLLLSVWSFLVFEDPGNGIDHAGAAVNALRALAPCFESLTRESFLEEVTRARARPSRQKGRSVEVEAAVNLANRFQMPGGRGPKGTTWTAPAFTRARRALEPTFAELRAAKL